MPRSKHPNGSDLVGVAFESEFGLGGNSEWTCILDIVKLRDTIRSFEDDLITYYLTMV